MIDKQNETSVSYIPDKFLSDIEGRIYNLPHTQLEESVKNFVEDRWNKHLLILTSRVTVKNYIVRMMQRGKIDAKTYNDILDACSTEIGLMSVVNAIYESAAKNELEIDTIEIVPVTRVDRH